MLIESAVRELLASDTTLTDMLSVYTPSGGGSPEPAIFTDQLVPEDADLPYIWVSPPLRNRRWGHKLTRGKNITLEVWCVAEHLGSRITASDIAERALNVLLDNSLTLESERRVVVADFDGPIGLETDESVIGRKITCSFQYL